MKILYLANNDIRGGAAKGAYRLHRGFVDRGIESTMLVRHKFSDDETVRRYSVDVPDRRRNHDDILGNEVYPALRSQYPETSSFNLRATGIDRLINDSDADVVIMHWIGNDTISIKELANIQKPIIWRLADMWAICGSRHYISDEDQRYVNGYPMVKSALKDIDAWLWARKKKYLAHKEITFVCGSEWLTKEVCRSPLYERASVNTIPSSIDTTIYAPPWDKYAAKKVLGLDDRKVIMFGADNATSDPRKGYDLLEEALRTLGCSVPRDAVQVIIFGTKDAYRTTIEGFDARSFGFVADEYLMALLYGTADVVVVPSRADNLPFTAIESLACGTPVVGFGIGGIPEIIDHKKNGYVAQPLSPKDLAKGIEWILFHSDAQSLGKQARKKADSEYAINVQVTRYLSLINEKFGIS